MNVMLKRLRRFSSVFVPHFFRILRNINYQFLPGFSMISLESSSLNTGGRVDEDFETSRSVGNLISSA